MDDYDWGYDYDYYDDNLAYDYVADDDLAYTYYPDPEFDFSYLGNYGFGYGNETYEIPNPAQEGQEGYGWRYFTDGTVIGPNGSYYAPNAEGNYTTPIWSPSEGIPSLLSKLGSLFKTDGKTDWRKVATAAGGLLGATGLGGFSRAQNTAPRGYQGGIPSYSLVRERVQDTYDPNRRPGSGGRRYFSDAIYAPAAGLEAAQTAAQEQAAGLASLNMANPANQYITAPTAPFTPTPQEPTFTEQEPTFAEQEPTFTEQEPTFAEQESAPAEQPASAVIEDVPVPEYNQGGIAALKKGTYLRGETDGMTDELRTTIDGKQPAALSHGEFVIPADVVSHLGNGNSDAGAKKLYEMMNKIRKARTGTEKQGRQINPNKFLPK
jgi:hypothetical protein